MRKQYHVRKGDDVEVLAGKWRGEKGKIVAVLSAKDRVVLEMVGLSPEKERQRGTRTVKKSQAAPNGGMVERAVSTHVSNVKKVG